MTEKELYKKLEIDFPISEGLQKAIDDLMNEINYTNGSCEDLYRSEIEFWLKNEYFDCKRITGEQYEKLKRYYVLGDIYKEMGKPYARRKKETSIKNIRKHEMER